MDDTEVTRKHFISLAVKNTSDKDLTQLQELGFTLQETHASNAYLLKPPHIIEPIALGYLGNLYEIKDIVKIFVVRRGCFCSDFHWDDYKGGDYSEVRWPTDNDWNLNRPNMPPLKPLTKEMKLAEEKALAAYRKKIKDARKLIDESDENDTSLSFCKPSFLILVHLSEKQPTPRL